MVIKVNLPYDPEWKALEWTKKNCPSYITNDVAGGESDYTRPIAIDYFFSDEKDATLFAMKFK